MSNGAAERLRRLLKKDQQYVRLQLLDAALADAVRSGYQQRKDFYPGDPEDLDAALAVERKATVELIQKRLAQWDELTDMAPLGLRGFIDGVLDSLDAEAAR